MDNSKKILSAGSYFWFFLGLFLLYGLGGWFVYAIIKAAIESLVPGAIIKSILMIVSSLFVTVVCIDLTITNMVYKRNVFTHKINIKKILFFTIIFFLLFRLLGLVSGVIETETKLSQLNNASTNMYLQYYSTFHDVSYEEAKETFISESRITEYVGHLIATLIGVGTDLLVVFVFQRRLLLKNCVENFIMFQ